MDVVIENSGLIVVINYNYDPLTLEIIQAYEKSYDPLPVVVRNAWDSVIRQLRNLPDIRETYVDEFLIAEDGDENVILDYARADIADPDGTKGVEILNLELDGQQTAGLGVVITLATGLVVFQAGTVAKDQTVKITYKKRPDAV